MTITKIVWIITEYVHRKNQFCAHFCGLPFFGSICNARMRAPMKRMHSIGAKFTVNLAIWKVASNLRLNADGPVSWISVRDTA